MAQERLINLIKVDRSNESDLSMTSNVNILNPQQAMAYIEKVTENENLLTLMKNKITLTHDYSQGFTEAEIKDHIEEIEDSNLRILIKKVLDLQKDETTLLTSTVQKTNNVRQTWVVQGERRGDGKFNLIEVHACQAKEIDKPKMAVYGITAASLACLAGTVFSPTTAAALGGAAVAAGAIKTAFDFNTCPQDIIYGYILRDLQNKNLLKFPNTNIKNQIQQ